MVNLLSSNSLSSSRKLRLALISAVYFSTILGIVNAQEKSEFGEDEIVVTGGRTQTGTKTDVSILETPQSLSIVTSEQFTDRAAVNLQDVFRYSPSINTERLGVDARGDFLVARGFALTQYLDGLNRMPDGNIYGARLEVFTLERAEVLLGPSAVLYGGVVRAACSTQSANNPGMNSAAKSQ